MEKIHNPNLIILELAAKQLQPLLNDLVFVGGCATGLLITDLAAAPVRVTKDVDVIVQVISLREYQRLSKRLRACEFYEDSSEGAPLCRWLSKGLVLDIMPTDKNILGFGNDWYELAVQYANKITLPSGQSIKLVSAPYFLMTKFEAFEGRGNGDFQMSHDIEDVIAVVDGRPELVEELRKSDKKLLKSLSKKVNGLIGNQNFVAAISGHMPPDAASQNRVPGIIQTLKQIAEINAVNE
jgi:predicted nucleotidyltransferase